MENFYDSVLDCWMYNQLNFATTTQCIDQVLSSPCTSTVCHLYCSCNAFGHLVNSLPLSNCLSHTHGSNNDALKFARYIPLYTRSPPQARAIKLRIALVLVEWDHAGGGEINIDLGQYWLLAAWFACIPLQRTHQKLYSVPVAADKQLLTTVVN